MFIEIRKDKKIKKYYLVHSYRDKDRIRKIRRYLGQNLNKRELGKAEKKAEKAIYNILEELNTEVFLFSLSKNQIDNLNKQNNKIKIMHFGKEDWQRFTEDFVYNTNAIEGSSVRKGEVPGILNSPRARGPEESETKGVAKAVDYIRKTKEDLSLELMKKLHRLCFNGSKNFAGKFRNVEVVITNSLGEIVHAGVPAAQLKKYLTEMIEWYYENKIKFKPLVLAAIIHNQFEHIHPFQDGNGRIGRLLLNFILLRNGYPPVNISMEDRSEYYRSLQEYSKNGNLKPTVKFLIKQYKKTLSNVATKSKAK